MRPCRRDLRAARFILLGFLSVAGSAFAQDERAEPKRLYSNGDSNTRAVDAFFPLDNLNLSWVNGYHGFWQRLFHIPNVDAHNQRISDIFGKRGRKNWIAAQNGARMEHLKDQAAEAAGKNATYATVMLGGNDVCRSDVLDLPEEQGFADNFRDGLDELLANLPGGATVYVVGIPDVPRLYDIGKHKELLGIVNCPFVWDLTGLCGSVLSSDSMEGDRDRAFIRTRITGIPEEFGYEGYNPIMKQVTMAKADALNPDVNPDADPEEQKFLYFTDASFTIDFQLEHISDLDCFHPSWEGQRELSRATWEDYSNGPNFENVEN